MLNSENRNVKLPWFLDPLFPPEDADEDLPFFLSLVFPNSLTTISILIISMPPTNVKFDPQVSNDETLPLPGPTIKQDAKKVWVISPYVSSHISEDVLFLCLALQSFMDLCLLTNGRFLNLFKHLVGLLGQVMSLS